MPVAQTHSDGSGAEDHGPPALWVQWQQRAAADPFSGARDPATAAQDPAQDAAAVRTCSEPAHAVSVRVGRVFAAWVPGFAGRLLQAASGWMPRGPAPVRAAERMPAAPAVSRGSSAQTVIGTEHTSWLSGAWEADLSIDSLQLAALAAEETCVEAVLVSISKLSGRLGPLKPVMVASLSSAGESTRKSATADLMRLTGDMALQHGARYAYLHTFLGLQTFSSHSTALISTFTIVPERSKTATTISQQLAGHLRFRFIFQLDTWA